MSHTLNSTAESVSTDTQTPVDSDGQPIRWVSDNPAELLGILDETAKFYQRRGLFVPFLEAGIVSLSNNKITFDSAWMPFCSSKARSSTPVSGLYQNPVWSHEFQ